MIPGFRRTFLAAGLLAAVFAPPVFAQQLPPTAPGTGSNFETRLESLEEQMRNLNGSIEQLGYSVRRLDQAMGRLQSDVDARVTKLESLPAPTTTIIAPPSPSATTVIPPAQEPAGNDNAPASTSSSSSAADSDLPPPAAPVKGTLGALKLQPDGKVTGATNNPQAPPLPDTPADYGLTPQEQYDRAFDLLRQTDYEEAGDAFKTFIDKNPKDKLVDDAKYWYAETLYVRNKFDSAAVAFADAYQQNPNGGKAPESLLKLAMSLEKLGKTADACTTLDSLKSKYSKAPLKIRQSADQERTSLKCSAQQASPPTAPAKKP